MTVKAYHVEINENFIGRRHQLARLGDISNKDEPQLLVVYGRRRVGKTELLEQAYRNRHLFKFEGIRDKSQEEQRSLVLWQLSEYLKNPLFSKINVKSWLEVFKILDEHLPNKPLTLYFEEIQWLADYQPDFISELKFAWDNYFRHKRGLLIILCGSSPSFIINEILHSKSLYNRSQHELHLKEFDLKETSQFLPKCSQREVMDAYLTVGGIPEYLKRLKYHSSVFTSLCEQSFTPDSYFANEFKRIFVSSLAESKHYKQIISILAKNRFLTRTGLLKALKIESSGTLTEILNDLILCGFVEKYTPYQANPDSTLARYCIADNYLQFYYKFIAPVSQGIELGQYRDNPMRAIKVDAYQKWLGFAFERMCRRHQHLIAKMLGFSAVHYRAGAFYNRATQNENPGFQFDLVFDRDDKVLSLCEIKYLQSPVTSQIIKEFDQKISCLPNPRSKTLHKVLITTIGMDKGLAKQHYFDEIITLDDFFKT